MRRPTREHLVLAGMVILFLATRWIDLGTFPVFLDEAIHVDWALKIGQTGHLLGITDGGRYLPIWIYALAVRWADDPLLGARLCSTLFGLLAMLGLMWTGGVLYGKAAGVLAGLFYVFLPAALLHDRMAMVDPLIVAFTVFALGCGARWAESGGLLWATAMGVLIGAATITKLYGALLFLLPVLFCVASRRSARRPNRMELAWIHGAALTAMLPVWIDFGRVLSFVRDNSWLFRFGIQGLLRNLGLVALWSAEYLTPFGVSLLLLCLVCRISVRSGADRILIVWWGVWAGFFTLVGGRDWFPRYLLPGLIPLLLLIADRIPRISQQAAERMRRPSAGRAAPWVIAGLWAFAAMPAVRAIWAGGEGAPLPGIDRWQYVEDWPSGFRLADVAAFVRGQVDRSGPLMILRHSGSGPALEGLDLMLRSRATGIEPVNLPFRGPGLTVAIPRLLAERRPMLLLLEQPVAPRLTLRLDGQALATTLSVFVKPGRLRRFEIDCISGPCSRPEDVKVDVDSLDLDDLGVSGVRAPGDGPAALDEVRQCGVTSGEASLEACRRALGLSLSWARRAEVHYNMGRQLVARGEYGEAARQLHHAARLMPKETGLGLGFVDTLELLGQHGEAVEALREILRYAPDSAAVHGRLGLNLARLGRLTDAEAELRRALALDPGTVGARNDLGVVLFLGGRAEDARATLREAVSNESESLRQHYNLAVVQAATAGSD